MKAVETDNERLLRLRKKVALLPSLPGVYIMLNKRHDIIYIGKAIKLKNRVSQYFRINHDHTEKVRQMVANVEVFEYIVCDSEFEALILECALIKQHSPKYNILLKDDKGYHYIKITNDEWPVIEAVKQKDDLTAEYIGPYNSFWVVKETVDEAKRIFLLPQCRKQFPRDIKKFRPCLNYHIGVCSAPCAGKIRKSEYLEAVNGALDFIKNGSQVAADRLKYEMEKAAEALEFEKAARIRDRISAISRVSQKQKIVESEYSRQDIIALAQSATGSAFEVFVFKEGRLFDREQFFIDSVIEQGAGRSEFIRRYYSIRDDVPPRIVLDGETEDIEILSQWLSEKLGKKVQIVIPQKGEPYKLAEMCRLNASEYLAEKLGKDRNEAALDELAGLLGLPKAPEYIEAYDISNTAGSENVAGMTVFFKGKPLKSAYKRFIIKGFEGQDDCRSMKEVLERRFNEYMKHEKEIDGFGRLPDLILLDGGKGQLSAVAEVQKELGLNIPMFGMVKDSKHKTRAIASNGGDIAIKANRKAYTLISTIQEETHRFAIGYHHAKHTKNVLSSKLLLIDGIGEARAEILMKQFKTIKNIENASIEELAGVKGMSRKAAENVFNYFNIDK